MSFFENVKTGYTFDDVLLVQNYCLMTSRSEVNLSTEIGKSKLSLPIISSNMTTVTGPEMVIAMSDLGCSASLHRFHDNIDCLKNDIDKIIEINANALLQTGISLSIDQRKNEEIMELINKYKEKNYNFGYFIIDVAHGGQEKVLRTVRWFREKYPKYYLVGGNVASSETALRLVDAGVDCVKAGVGPGCFVPETQVRTKKGSKKIKDVVNGDEVLTHKFRYKKVINTVKYKTKEKLISINGVKSTKIHKYYVIDKKDKDVVNNANIHEYAKWVSAKDLSKEKHLLIKNINLSLLMNFELIEIKEIEEIDYEGIVIDLTVEDDHTYNVSDVIVHNSACTTRRMSGVGYPQLSCIKEISETVGDCVSIIADGGIRNSGDIVKALAAGADFVMLGSLLAGTFETPGQVLTIGTGNTEKKVKLFTGMASYDAQIKHFKKDKKDFAAEGVANFVNYKGSVKNVIYNLERGIRSGFTYCGCQDISEMHEHGKNTSSWVKITNSGYNESIPHTLLKTM